ncbi:hypothetical protein MED217_18215 [Leeuwenhoekiella blandensis MED217]|uniref:Uncharacterized protein n=1 Tax=Leeuwenhoekiella blandensis (strain CECT 7118 / CCUG 51940 / KCTC 22103 / MED217) TaxID=398720 RepID=A3XGU2_LEEBM|nr:hypothetical protein MED217_18215 [Leeuwenhoekiella blandensis MED217]
MYHNLFSFISLRIDSEKGSEGRRLKF